MVSHKQADGAAKRSAAKNADRAPSSRNAKPTAASNDETLKALTPDKPPVAKRNTPVKTTASKVKAAPAPEPEPPVPAKAPARKRAVKVAKAPASEVAAPAAPEAAPSAPKKAAAKKAVAKKAAPKKIATPKGAAPKAVTSEPAAPKKAAPTSLAAKKAEAPATPKAARRITRKVQTAAAANSTPTPSDPEPVRVPPHREALSPAAVGAAEAEPPKSASVTPPQPQTPAPPSSPSRVVLMIRDPEWLYAYWELSPADLELHAIGRPHGAPPLLLRVIDMGIATAPAETGNYFDVTVIPDANGWYIHIPHDGGHWCAALGYLNYEAEFVGIAHSNVVTTPSPIQSEWNEQAWGPVSKESEVLGTQAGVEDLEEPTGVALGPSRIVRRAARAMAHLRGGEHFTRPGASEHFPRPGASEQFMRPGASEQFMRPGASEQFPRPGASEQFMRPGASEQFAGASGLAVRREAVGEKGKTFWLQVYTELIVYGATEPDAAVTVQGQPIRLRPDGTFTLRYALPDGEQVIPVHAVNADGDMEETITPIVTKRTV